MGLSLKHKTWKHIDNGLDYKECCRGKGRPAMLLGMNAQRRIGYDVSLNASGGAYMCLHLGLSNGTLSL